MHRFLATARRLFQRRFSRFLLAVAVLLTAAATFTMLEIRRARRQERALASLQKLGAHVWFSHEYDVYGSRVFNSRPACPAWLRERTAPQFLMRAIQLNLVSKRIRDEDLVPLQDLTTLEQLQLDNTHIGDDGLRFVAALRRLEQLSLSGTEVTSQGLKHLAGLTHLVDLNLNRTRIGDRGLQHLVGLVRLQALNLNATNITDRGLASVAHLGNLRVLTLVNTRITDAGLRALRGLARLERLDLMTTGVTAEGVRRLKLELPGCLISTGLPFSCDSSGASVKSTCPREFGEELRLTGRLDMAVNAR